MPEQKRSLGSSRTGSVWSDVKPVVRRYKYGLFMGSNLNYLIVLHQVYQGEIVMARTPKPKQVQYKGDTYTITKNSGNMATIRGSSGSWTVSRYEVKRALEEAKTAHDVELENWNQTILSIMEN